VALGSLSFACSKPRRQWFQHSDHAKDDARAGGDLDHAARRGQVGRDRLLHLHVFVMSRRDLDGLKAEIGQRADVDVVDFWMTAERLNRVDELAAVLIDETFASVAVDIRAGPHAEPDAVVGAGVQMGDRTGTDQSDSHWLS
jgi:hypothetical protein